MPAIAMLPPTEPVAPVQFFYINRWADAPPAQGSEAEKVFAKAEEVYSHWNDRTEVLIAPIENMDALSYNHIPLKCVSYVKTRYRFVGRMKPRLFPLDE